MVTLASTHFHLWGLQDISAINPYFCQLLLNLRVPVLPLLDLPNVFPEFLELPLHVHLLLLCSDALIFPFVPILSEAKGEVKRVVFLQRCSRRDCD